MRILGSQQGFAALPKLPRSFCLTCVGLVFLTACSGNRQEEPRYSAEQPRDVTYNTSVERSVTQALPPPIVSQQVVSQAGISQPATSPTFASYQQPQVAPTTPSYSSAEIGRLVQTSVVERAKSNPGWADAIDAFYGRYGYQPVWYRGAWSPEAYSAYEALSNSWLDGLPSHRYLSASGLDLFNAQSAHEIAAVELALTQGMMTFMPELQYGMGSPVASTASLHQGLASGDLEGWLEALRPQTALYQGYRKAMQSMSMTDDQKRTLALNMHRARHAKEQIHAWKRIRVNIPGFKLEAIEGGQVTGAMKVIVGQPDRPTPELADRIVNLKFSPDWNVPQVAASEDLLPLLKRDARALVNKMGLQAFRRGKAVNPSSVNWSKYSASNLPYTFRQKPGQANALGGVRFSLTNPRAIFLHDTPEKDLFGENLRSISSGCVRVEDAEGLSAWILKDTAGWDRSKISAAMTASKTSIKKLKQPVAVDMVYYTASLDQSGNLHFHRDIYGKDQVLAAQLGI